MLHHLRCPSCQSVAGADVVDSRCNPAGTVVRRRRQCRMCSQRFTTYESRIDPLVLESQQRKAHAIAAQLRDMAGLLEVW